MAKKQQDKPKQAQRIIEPETAIKDSKKEKNRLSIINFKVQAAILAFIILIFYCNTFNHEYAFDDMMAIVDNDYVQQGISGIPKIMTTDAFQSYLEHKSGSNQLAGGRYRPLSLITFAVEQQFLGTRSIDDLENVNPSKAKNEEQELKLINDMHFRHVIQVLLYIIAIIAILFFLRRVVLPHDPLIAFIATLLFAAHPLHTEVVANVKSRDEILSILFISLTFIKAFSYWDTKKIKELIYALIFLFLALLSKEYAVTLLVLLPLSFYIFRNADVKKSALGMLPYQIPIGIYLLLRFSAVSGMSEGAEFNIMNNPYLYATSVQKFASIMSVLLDYIKLLFVPFPLVVDYSYHQISYSDFTNIKTWFAIGSYIAILFTFYKTILKRNLFAFISAFYLLNLMLISNILFNIGAPMGERLIFHSSLAFCIFVAYFLINGIENGKAFAFLGNSKRYVWMGIVIFTLGVYGVIAINRNACWKNNETLFLHDVKISTNSVLVNNDAAASCMKLAKKATDTVERKIWLAKAIVYFDKVISIHPRYTLAYVNQGLCYYNGGNPDRALIDWDTARNQNPNMPNLAKYLNILGNYYLNQAIPYLQTEKHEQALTYLKKGAQARPEMPEIWFYMAVVYSRIGKVQYAIEAVDKSLKLAPNNVEAKKLKEQLQHPI